MQPTVVANSIAIYRFPLTSFGEEKGRERKWGINLKNEVVMLITSTLPLWWLEPSQRWDGCVGRNRYNKTKERKFRMLHLTTHCTGLSHPAAPEVTPHFHVLPPGHSLILPLNLPRETPRSTWWLVYQQLGIEGLWRSAATIGTLGLCRWRARRWIWS